MVNVFFHQKCVYLRRRKTKSSLPVRSVKSFSFYHTTEHGGKPIGEKLFFLIKIENFYQKKTTSLQSNPSRTPFERSEKQCVVSHVH